eukprot:12783093-Prorocentrum_lima.AAC.1
MGRTRRGRASRTSLPWTTRPAAPRATSRCHRSTPRDLRTRLLLPPAALPRTRPSLATGNPSAGARYAPNGRPPGLPSQGGRPLRPSLPSP